MDRSFKQELTAKWTISESVRVSIIAALYIGLTMLIAPLAYGVFQLRISEMLGLLPFDRKYGGRSAAIGVVLGGTVVGFMSPHGGADLIIGMISGIICVAVAWYIGTKGNSNLLKQLTGFAYSIITTFFIGYLMLHVIFQCPLWESLYGVFIGEIIAINGLGFLLLKGLERTYK